METSEIAQLRKLLLKLDEEELDKLKRLLNYPNDLAEEISSVLPESVLMSIHDSNKLSSALIPMIEQVITRSVAQNPRLLADALYPIIGRSIRKSINEEFKKLLQTFNELIENTFSYRSLKWRYQSLITGRKYSEIVISNTIKYKAEHIFLIHKETGLLLCEAHDELGKTADPDMVSGMLKAITDFVHDSFEDTGNSELNLIEMDEYQVVIEQGPHAILASLVKGFTIDEYRKVLSMTLEQVHDEYANSLVEFEGDSFLFESARDLLLACLKTEKKEEFSSKKSKIGLFIAVPVLLMLLFLLGRSVYSNYQFRMYINKLENTEHVLLSHYGKNDGRYFVHGLLLPGSVHPDSLINRYKFRSKNFISTWHLYIPSNNDVLLDYIKKQIGIPKQLTIAVSGEEITIEGVCTVDYIKDFTTFITRKLPWFTVNQKDIHTIREDDVQNQIDRFVNTHLFFGVGEMKLTQESREELLIHASSILKIISDAEVLDKKIVVVIKGYADQLGDETFNQQLSKKRAEYVLNELKVMGVPAGLLSAEGKGVLLNSDVNNENFRRRVDFQISVE